MGSLKYNTVLDFVSTKPSKAGKDKYPWQLIDEGSACEKGTGTNVV